MIYGHNKGLVCALFHAGAQVWRTSKNMRPTALYAKINAPDNKKSQPISACCMLFSTNSSGLLPCLFLTGMRHRQKRRTRQHVPQLSCKEDQRESCRFLFFPLSAFFYHHTLEGTTFHTLCAAPLLAAACLHPLLARVSGQQWTTSRCSAHCLYPALPCAAGSHGLCCGHGFWPGTIAGK